MDIDHYLETDRLELRILNNYSQTDVCGVMDVLGDPDTAWLFDVSPVEYYDEAIEFIRYNDACSLGLYDKESGEMVGILQIIDPPGMPDTVELGYALSEDNRGKGFMTEAVKAICRKQFEYPSISKIRLRILPENEESIRVATRCGFKWVDKGPEERDTKRIGRLPLDEYVLLRDETINTTDDIKP